MPVSQWNPLSLKLQRVLKIIFNKKLQLLIEHGGLQSEHESGSLSQMDQIDILKLPDRFLECVFCNKCIYYSFVMTNLDHPISSGDKSNKNSYFPKC